VARNVEIKARVGDLGPVEARARTIATEGPVQLSQDDTFFPCARGRLKLRQFADGRGELIHYFRDDESGPKVSDYLISPIAAPGVLREALSRAFGTAGRVRKHRLLYVADRTRIHLDEVEGLGAFVELEVVLRDGESVEAGETVARHIMGVLGIDETQLVRGAYVDMQSQTAMRIEIDDLSRPAIHALLNEHLKNMHELSPPGSVHALDLDKLRKPGITFWSAWEGPVLLGCGALKELDRKHGEVKSMRTPAALRRKGAGRAILAHIVEVARSRSYQRLSLETGSAEAFKPAQRLYESFGFEYCGRFGEYADDPNSVFMTMPL